MLRISSRGAPCLAVVLLLLVAAGTGCKATSPLDNTASELGRELLATGFTTGYNGNQIQCACLRAFRVCVGWDDACPATTA